MSRKCRYHRRDINLFYSHKLSINRPTTSAMTPRLTVSILIFVLSFSAAGAFAPSARSADAGLAKIYIQRHNPTQTAGRPTNMKSASCSNGRAKYFSLRMTTVPVAAITGALTGGLFAGGLHAIAGKLKSNPSVLSPWGLCMRTDFHVFLLHRQSFICPRAYALVCLLSSSRLLAMPSLP